MSEKVGTRVIAVEEHFATESFWKQTADMSASPGSEDEKAFTRHFIDNPFMHRRFTDPQTHLDDMDNAGVDMAVRSLNPPGVQLWSDADRATALARETNDALVDVVAGHPGRFGALASVAPQHPEGAAEEIVRAMETLGFGGVLIGSHTGGRYLDEPECEPILAALEQTDATLYLHPRMPSPQMLEPFRPFGLQQAVWGFQAEAGTHAMRLITSGTLDRHPNLKIVLGHLGEGLPFWLWRTDNIYAKTYQWAHDVLGMVKLELTPSEYFLRNFSVTTSGMFDTDVLQYCLTKLGPERILFAIDYPYEDSDVATDFLAAADIDDEARASISHSNAERLFRIAPTT